MAAPIRTTITTTTDKKIDSRSSNQVPMLPIRIDDTRSFTPLTQLTGSTSTTGSIDTTTTTTTTTTATTIGTPIPFTPLRRVTARIPDRPINKMLESQPPGAPRKRLLPQPPLPPYTRPIVRYLPSPYVDDNNEVAAPDLAERFEIAKKEILKLLKREKEKGAAQVAAQLAEGNRGQVKEGGKPGDNSTPAEEKPGEVPSGGPGVKTYVIIYETGKSKTKNNHQDSTTTATNHGTNLTPTEIRLAGWFEPWLVNRKTGIPIDVWIEICLTMKAKDRITCKIPEEFRAFCGCVEEVEGSSVEWKQGKEKLYRYIKDRLKQKVLTLEVVERFWKAYAEADEGNGQQG